MSAALLNRAAVDMDWLDSSRARAFLEALGGSTHTFLAFGEGAEAGNKTLTKEFHGTFDANRSELADLSGRGAGIFVTVNETDQVARKKENIRSIRACFVDLDGAPIKPVLECAAPPHVVVESSPGRWHAYWIVSNCALLFFPILQRALAAMFHGDPTVNDIARVMRLPGSLHRKKGGMFRCRIASLEVGPSYTVQRLMSDLAISVPVTEEARSGTSQGSGPSGPSASSVTSAPSASSVTPPFPDSCLPLTEGQRNRALFELARHLKALSPHADNDELRTHVRRWHAQVLATIGTKEFDVTWGEFRRMWAAVRTPKGSVLSKLLDAARARPLPAGVADLGYGEKCNLLVKLCAELHDHQGTLHGSEPFILPCRTAGECIGANRNDASAMIHCLIADGVLELAVSHTTRLASRYRFVWSATH